MIELDIDRIANGGDGIGSVDGKTVFVPGAVPGDRATIEIVEQRKRFDRGRLVDLIRPSADRTAPLCRHTAVCGGCTWQQVDYQAQLEWKRDIVASQLRHLAGVEIDIAPTLAVGPPFHYRNRMDYSVHDGRLALHRRASHDLVALQECRLVVEPLAQVVSAAHALEDLGGGGRRVTLRAGVSTGDLVAVVDAPIEGLPISQAHPSEAVLHEEVHGSRFRISGRAFFQANTPGAERLVDLVSSALGPVEGRSIVDLYAGVGLFAATVADAADRVVAFELDRRAVSDLETNAPTAEIVMGPIEKTLGSWSEPGIDLVVADPPRDGMGARVVEHLTRLGPEVIASVSCDAATFARDTRSLMDSGYRLEWVQPVDLFPHTPHVEIVARLWR